MFCMLKKKKIYPANASKNNSNREKQVTLLMNPNKEKRKWSETLAKEDDSIISQ